MSNQRGSVPLSRPLAYIRRVAIRAHDSHEIKRLARNVAWSSSGVVLSQVITLVAYMLLARYIGKENFGQFTIIQSTANTVAAFAGLGFGLTATKYIAEFRERNPAQAGSVFTLITLITLLWTALLASVVWILAPEIAIEVLKRAELASSVRVGAALLFFTAIMNVQNGALAGFESFDAVAKTSMLRGFLILPFLLLGAALGGVRGSLLGFAAAAALVCVINANLLQRRCNLNSMHFSIRGSFSGIRLLAAFSIPAFLANIVPAPCLSLAQMFLIRQPGGYGDLAVFTAAFQLRAGIILLPALLSQPLVPMMANMSSDKGLSRSHLLRATFAATLFISVGLAGIVCIFPKFLMLAYGHSFAGNTAVLILLAVSAVINSSSNPFSAAITSSGKIWSVFWGFAAWGVTFLVATYSFVPTLHATALAVAYVIADSVQCVVIFIAYWRNQKYLGQNLSAKPVCAV
jgi:O-antigen/teichoic acid export membrane protein